jgi:ribosome assembly protein YihI (activator of Der GTPase)
MVNKKTTEKQRKISEAKCWLFGKKKKKKTNNKIDRSLLEQTKKTSAKTQRKRIGSRTPLPSSTNNYMLTCLRTWMKWTSYQN